MREIKDASTDIIVVSNELFRKEEISKDFDKNFGRGCNIIEVTSLQPISIMQRIVYALLEKNSFVARDADHIVFTLLSEYSRGAATIVHMLTSLMQKSEDNSRTGFELAKQQLKLHIAHQKGLQRYGNTAKITSIENGTGNSNANSFFSSLSSNTLDSTHSLLMYATKPDTKDATDNLSTHSSLDTEASDNSSSDSKADSNYDSMHGSNKNLTISEKIVEAPLNNIADDPASKTWFQQNNILTDMSTGPKYTEEQTVIAERYMTQTDASDSDVEDLFDLPESYKTAEDKSIPFPLQNSLHLFINDLLMCDEYSIPTHHLLNCLCVIGPIPIPLLLIEELDNIIIKATTGKDNGVQSSVTSLTKQLEAGVLRKYPQVFLYHKDLNPEFQVATFKLMYIPRLLCDSITSNMHSGDFALSIACVQQAIKNILMQINQLSINHLHLMLVVVNQLEEPCSNLDEKFNEENIKLKVQIVYSIGSCKEVLA